MTTPKVTVLIPTWNAPMSVGPAIDSALNQTVRDIEVLVVLDGAHDETAGIVRARQAGDARVRILDLPKAPSRGEANRHRGVLAARAPVVAYLADDDLLLPRHLENLLALLADHDLVQSLNGWIDACGSLHLHAADLADPRWREFHRTGPPDNRISITGTAHTAASYRELALGWVVPEMGIPADLNLWRQFLADPAIRVATHAEMTTLQFPAPARHGMHPADIETMRALWEHFVREPDCHERLQALATDAAFGDLLDVNLHLRAMSVARAHDEARITSLHDQLREHRATLSWRITRPLRAVRARFRRNSSSQ